MTDTPTTAAEQAAFARTYADWSSPRGLRTDSLPWQLWEKAKRLVWDPADLDLARDAEDLAALPMAARIGVAELARGFLIGEEGVTLDVLPLIMAIADEGRVEEVMYLTTFAFEEAKHVDFFRRWVEAVGLDFDEIDAALAGHYRSMGMEPPPRQDPVFERELPAAMRRLLTDRSPEAILDASVTYNQFVEGCLAIAGYRVWDNIFEELGAFAGLKEGLSLVRRDESRHVTYGTYLCRRLIGDNPAMLERATRRLRDLHAGFLEGNRAAPDGNGPEPAGTGGGYGAGAGGEGPLGLFGEFLEVQVGRRVQVLARPQSRPSRGLEMALEDV